MRELYKNARARGSYNIAVDFSILKFLIIYLINRSSVP